MAEAQTAERSIAEFREIALLVAHNTPAELAQRIIRLRREVLMLQALLIGNPAP